MNGGDGSGVWKWIAAILVAIILAGIPTVVQSFRSPSRDDVAQIRERQLEVLVRLATIEAQLRELERRLDTHERNQTGGQP